MIRAAILTISDSVAAGTREDRSGPALEEKARALGWEIVATGLLPDEKDLIAERLRTLADGGHADVILTTGGTGVTARDVTPEATLAVLEKPVPGLGELMRAEGRKVTPRAMLSRAAAGTRAKTLIVNLPGSPRGAAESFDTIAGLIPHAVDLLKGKTAHG